MGYSLLYFAHQTNRVRVFRRWFRSCRDHGTSAQVGPVPESVGPVTKSVVAESTVVTAVVVGISLSLSFPLSVVESMAITVGPVSKSVVESTVVTTNQPGLSLSLGLSLGFPLSVVK